MDRRLFVVAIFSLVTCALVWAPFIFGVERLAGIKFGGVRMERIVQNFDGINFLVVAKSWYDPDHIQVQYADILSGRRNLYFAAHYPGYPALISFFDLFLTGPQALIASIILSNIALSVVLYIFFRQILTSRDRAMWLTIFTMLFPARMLAVRIVGSSEMLFMIFLYLSLIYTLRARHLMAALAGSAAILTRSPAILLFGAHLAQAALLLQRGKSRVAIYQLTQYMLIPLALIALFVFYGIRYNNFLAYFQVGGNLNIHYPFAVFASDMAWSGNIWQEEIIFLFVFAVVGFYKYLQFAKWNVVSIFAAIYIIFTFSVAHQDLSRYLLPVTPVIISGWLAKVPLSSVKWLTALLLIPAIMFTWQFVLNNYQPITDWSRFL